MNYRNEVILSGHIVENFKFHHFSGIKIFEGKIEIERRSGAKDVLILQISERRLKETVSLEEGDGIIIFGELRTYRYMGTDNKMHDKNYVYVERTCYTFNPDMTNQVKISGTIVKKGTLRITQFGGTNVTEAIIASKSNNGYQHAYVPVIFWDEMAKEVFFNYKVGSEITIQGRFQSRDYVKKPKGGSAELKTTFEVSTNRIIL
jgi:single-stranded DNA-binding protein